ncbi:MAG: hypothetical protein U1A72_07725 [Sulfuritalea sp.]|nr:hypothetical protein [Sulfuritalea sp.]
MNVKKYLVPLLLGGLFTAAAHAEPVAKPDPLLASFQRLLDHQPAQSAPAVPSGLGADPLRNSVSLVLWETLEPSFHMAKLGPNLGPNLGRLVAPRR